ncbi:Crp/Fnr family transcriptional regulator [Caballeronia fortuita]|nr:Crp/Fnr family transcriptional regulator [Caballeronia fortuita]
MKIVDDHLSRSPWFSGLPADLQQAVRNGIVSRVVEPDGYVCRRGDHCRHWVGVVDGLVKVCNSSQTGRLMTFAGIPPGAWFGEGTVLKSEQWHYDAIALRPSLVALLPAELFFRILDESLFFNRFLLEHINERLGQLMATVQNDRLSEPSLRVSNCLLAMFNPKLYPICSAEIALTQEEIGYLSGITRQKVNRAVRRLQEVGLVNVSYGRVEVTNVEGLRRFAEASE